MGPRESAPHTNWCSRSAGAHGEPQIVVGGCDVRRSLLLCDICPVLFPTSIPLQDRVVEAPRVAAVASAAAAVVVAAIVADVVAGVVVDVADRAGAVADVVHRAGAAGGAAEAGGAESRA